MNISRPWTLLTLCGSLRSASIHAALLRSLPALAPPGCTVREAPSPGRLPLFNPEMASSQWPVSVVAWLEALANADAVVIASPEYAHGLTGTLKNALDWSVDSPFWVGKPTAVMKASERSIHADAALRETLGVMSARVVAAASITVPLLGAGESPESILAQASIQRQLSGALEALGQAVVAREVT